MACVRVGVPGSVGVGVPGSVPSPVQVANRAVSTIT